MPKIPNELILEDIRQTIKKTNDTSLKSYKKNGKYSECAVRRVLAPKTWNEYIKFLGYEVAKEYKISRDRIVQDVKEVFEQTGDTRRENYLKRGKYSRAAIKRLFGGWNGLLKELGVEINMIKPSQYTKEDVLADYRKVEMDFGRPISAKEYRKHGSFSQPIIDKVFGSFSELKKLLGERVDGKFVTDEEIWDNLREIAKAYGTISEPLLCQVAIVSYPTILKRIGNAKIICNKLGIKPSKEDSKLSQQCISILSRYIGEKYIQEKTYPWLVNSKTGSHLFVDYAYEDKKLAIEVDGPQHYREISFFGEKSLKLNQQRDREKDRLLKEHGYVVIRIRKPDPEYIKNKLLEQNMI